MADRGRGRGDPTPPTTTDPALGGPLFVTPAGSVIVATDALTAHGEALDRLHADLLDDAMRLDRVEAPAHAVLATASAQARRSVAALEDARGVVRSAADLAASARHALHAAIANYDSAEARLQAGALELAKLKAMALGPLLRALLPGSLAAGTLAWFVLRDPHNREALREWMLAHPEIITSPAFVEGVREAVMSTDDLAGSVMGLPPGAMEQLLAPFGFTGVAGGAVLMIGAGRPAGLFGETPVAVHRVATTAGSRPPVGVEEHLARVPEGNQVRIERYDAPGQQSRYVVYVGPTETFSPVTDTEPWDLSSNVNGVAGLDAGSIRATETAMRDAGIAAGDPVQFVGFSQGGLVATRLAASSDWNAAGLETFGAPAGNVELPDGLAGMAIRNSDDFVPALAGPQLDHHLLQVERQAFAPGSVIPSNQAAPAHQRDAYVATASVVDQAQSDAVRQQIAAMDAFTGDYAARDGSSITVMTYHAERVDGRPMAPTQGPVPLSTGVATASGAP